MLLGKQLILREQSVEHRFWDERLDLLSFILLTLRLTTKYNFNPLYTVLNEKVTKKLRISVLLGHSEDFKPETASQIMLRNCLLEASGEPECIRAFVTKDQVDRTSKDYCELKKTGDLIS